MTDYENLTTDELIEEWRLIQNKKDEDQKQILEQMEKNQKWEENAHP